MDRLRQLAKNLPISENFLPYHWRDVFQHSLEQCFVVSLVGMLESYLRSLCDIIHDGETKKVDDYPGRKSFPDKVRRYLMDYQVLVGDLDWPTISALWRIRNVISHNQGLCLKAADITLLSAFASENSGISIVNNSVIIEDTAFCKRALLTIADFGLRVGHLVRAALTGDTKTADADPQD